MRTDKGRGATNVKKITNIPKISNQIKEATGKKISNATDKRRMDSMGLTVGCKWPKM